LPERESEPVPPDALLLVLATLLLIALALGVAVVLWIFAENPCVTRGRDHTAAPVSGPFPGALSTRAVEASARSLRACSSSHAR
jgi:peptidoglycan/LPS O-acetylase OafA/YrhL